MIMVHLIVIVSFAKIVGHQLASHARCVLLYV